MLWIKWLAGAVIIGLYWVLSQRFWPSEPVLLRFVEDARLEPLIIGAVIVLVGLIIVRTKQTAMASNLRRERQEEKARERRQSKLKQEEPAAWVQGHDDLSLELDKMVALNKVPRVMKKLRSYWGYPEFLELTHELLTVEHGREGREGFDPLIHQEVNALRHFYIENIEKVMSPSLTEAEKDRIRDHIRKQENAGVDYPRWD
jgi:hypothetical protein